MRHILIANVHFAPFTYGGATVVAEEVARALMREAGYRITAVSTCQRPELVPYALMRTEQGGIQNYLINLPLHRTPAEHYDNPQVTERMIEIIAAEGPDLVHAHCLQDLGTGVLEAAAGAGVPAILSTHDYWWRCPRQFMIRLNEVPCGQDPVAVEGCAQCLMSPAAGQVRQSHLHRALTGVARVTYPSAFAMGMADRSGLAKGKGRLWRNGVHQPRPDFAERQVRRRGRDGRFTFGFLGGPSTMKGWPLIRAAFAELGRSDFRVLLAEGSRDGHWWEGADFSGLPGQWTVAPRFNQGEMDEFYAEIDLLLFPSQWHETFGLVVQEALARGIPVIQTAAGGSAEHGCTAPEDVLPMGADPAQLRSRVEAWLERGRKAEKSPPKRSFSDQAAEFDGLVTEVLG